MNPTPLPNLFIIGAAKCGTTSLHRYLDAHDDISMSDPKEPGLFSFTPWEERIRRYAGMMCCESPVRGESSTRYTYFPSVQHVPARIASLVPEAKLIYLVRDPVDRVVAHYIQQYASVMEQRTLGSAIRDLDQPGNLYVAPSRYATQIEQWLNYFPADQVMVIDQVDLRDRRHETMVAVLRFIGVEEEVPSIVSEEYNASHVKERLTPQGARMWFTAMPLIKRLPSWVGYRLLGSRLFPIEKIGRPALDDGLRALLEDELRGEAQRLRKITGQSFGSWSV